MTHTKSRSERKLAARLLMRDLRAARSRGSWSDGHRIYRGSEIDYLVTRLSHRLVNDTGERRPKIPRYGNVVQTLRTIRRNPGIHGLDDDVANLFSGHARKTYIRALSGTSGSLDHFVLARRYARRLGSAHRSDMPLGSEHEALQKRLSRPCAVELPRDVASHACVRIPAGTRLAGNGDGTWVAPDGTWHEIAQVSLVDVGAQPSRLTRRERRMLPNDVLDTGPEDLESPDGP